MDSLTQIVLGAACGELVAGKKIGNRAMIWGGIAGTIPDLDVLSQFVSDEITALAFHRGISHSLFFAVLAPVLFGFLSKRLYDSDLYKTKGWRIGITSFWILLLAIPALSANLGNGFSPLSLVYFGVLAALVFLISRTYWKKELKPVEMSLKQWYFLFFLAIITHPMLDCCTAYGTQIFQPFLDTRVAWDNISVADPAYTVPFMIPLIIAAFFRTNLKMRSFLNILGIGLSSIYLTWTVFNKLHVNDVFEKSLQTEAIPYKRYRVSPTILNNFLWSGIAETEEAFYMGQYSILDEEEIFSPLTRIEKNHHLLDGHMDDEEIKTLIWFSDNYFNVILNKDSILQYNDLRYGTISGKIESEEDYIFFFQLREEDGVLRASQKDNKPPDINQEGLKKFYDRIKGIKEPADQN